MLQAGKGGGGWVGWGMRGAGGTGCVCVCSTRLPPNHSPKNPPPNPNRMSKSADLNRQHMKLEARLNMLRSEKASMEKVQSDMYRIRMEKACVLLLARWKEERGERRVREIQEGAAREKEEIVAQLKEMYYQMVQVCDLERQAVEAARGRGEQHLEGLQGTKEAVEKWFKSRGGG